MTVAILCDGSREIGAGHFFRCLAIARELIKQSVTVVFFIPCRDLQSFIVKSGVDYKLLYNLFSNSEKVMENIITNLNILECDIVLIDSHRVTQKLLLKINKRYKIAYIDDLLLFPYSVDILINAHIDVTEEDYLVLYKRSGIAVPILLIGTKFFPTKTPIFNNEIRTKEKNVAFFAGGSDPDHVTIRMLKYLFEHQITIKYKFHIVIGMMNSDYDMILDYCNRFQFIQIHYGLSDLTEIYRQINLAVSASGITLYELASFGIPIISYSMVDNQIHTSEVFDILGISIHIGDSRYDSIFKKMFSNIDKLLLDEKKAKTMSNKAISIIDGMGALRISECLIKKE